MLVRTFLDLNDQQFPEEPKQGADFNWQCWTHDPDSIKIELMQISEESPQMKFIRSIEG